MTLPEIAGHHEDPNEHVSRRSRSFSPRLSVILLGVILAALLALPGATVTTKYVNDLFIFLDGAYRILQGQVPNIDFHTSLGPIAFYLPAFGLGVTGQMGGAMPVGMALAVLVLAVIAAEIITGRMRSIIGVPLALFLLLGVAAPSNTGEGVGELSFAMFYNRLGWTSLGLLIVMYLPRHDGVRRDLPDALCATVLVLLMTYTKITYGLVELAFLVFLLFDPRQRRWVAISLGLTVASVLIIESFWGGGLNHIADLRLASDVSGGLPTLRTLGDVVLRNLPDVAIYAIFALLLLWLRRRLCDLLFVGFCAGGGVMIIEQNFQIIGIVTLGASAAVIAELLTSSNFPARQAAAARGLPLLLAALLLPAAAVNATNLSMHAFYGLSTRGEPVPLPAFQNIRLLPMWSEGQFATFQRYNASLADGAGALAALGEAPERVAVLDFVNPFSAGMTLPPPVGDSTWYHWGRTLNREHHPKPQDFFADVRLILDPKSPIEAWTANGMRDIYADYIAHNFQLAVETEHWRVYRRRS